MTEWKASEYARISELQHTMAEEVLALLDLKGNERVLDIGCGNGKNTGEIAARVPEGSVVGADFSANMVAFASSQYAASHPNLKFQVADARHLPFGPEFDLVVSFNALHWVPEQELALRSIHAALKPEGRAQLRMVFRGERKSLEDVLQETCHSARWHSYFTSSRDPYLHLTPKEYAALAEQSGLEVRQLHTAAKAWDFRIAARPSSPSGRLLLSSGCNIYRSRSGPRLSTTLSTDTGRWLSMLRVRRISFGSIRWIFCWRVSKAHFCSSTLQSGVSV